MDNQIRIPKLPATINGLTLAEVPDHAELIYNTILSDPQAVGIKNDLQGLQFCEDVTRRLQNESHFDPIQWEEYLAFCYGHLIVKNGKGKWIIAKSPNTAEDYQFAIRGDYYTDISFPFILAKRFIQNSCENLLSQLFWARTAKP